MKSLRLFLGGLAAALAVTALTLPTPSLADSSSDLAPDSVTQVTGYGVTTGNINDLASQDHATFVSLTTPTSKPYRADYTFTLPNTTFRNTILTMQVKTSYNGQLKKQQTWTWLLYNPTTKKWVTVGTNASVTTASTWTDIAFNLPAKTVPMNFIDPTSRQIKVRVQSNNAKFDAEMDYLAVSLTLAAQSSPLIGGCTIFPQDNVWNARVDSLPVDKNSASYIKSLGSTTGLHPDFDAVGDGIPYNLATNASPTIDFTSADKFLYGDESDLANYPMPNGFLQEGGGDAHILNINTSNCNLYELYAANINGVSNSTAGSGAIFNLTSNLMRGQLGWTSADAAGLPILPGLVKFSEVNSGHINHAVRFTANHIRNAYIWPASHNAGCGATATNMKVAPMGQRFRLKASYAIPDSFDPQTKVVLTALKQYGMILADCGSNWYISGEPSNNWNDDALVPQLRSVPGSMFEAVDESSLMSAPDSYAVAP